MAFVMKIDVLGTEYSVEESDVNNDPKLEDCDGYCDTSTKSIVTDSLQKKRIDSKGDMESYKRSVLRHELIHAMLYESGLSSSSWARNEELVEWIAIQYPKMSRIFNAAGCARQ